MQILQFNFNFSHLHLFFPFFREICHYIGASCSPSVSMQSVTFSLIVLRLRNVFLTVLLILGSRLFQQTHSEILRRIAYKIKLSQHQFDLFNQFTCTRRLPEFDCLNEGRFKLVSQNVCSFNLENVVTERYEICNGIGIHICSSFQECLHLPLLVIPWIQLLIMCSC